MARPVEPIAGRVVAVTGGARGIGEAIARTLAGRGARVVIGDVDEAAVRATAASIGGGTIGRALDVRSTESVAAFLDHVEATLGPVDVLVNNAGVMWVGDFEDEPEAAADRMFDVNFHGVARGVRLAAPRMRARGSGHIVTVASVASHVAPAGEATYAASKHAVLGYLTAVRQELRGTAVRLSVVMPIVVKTELAAGTSPGGMPALEPQDVADAVLGAIERPRFEVFVPARVGALTRLLALLPQRGRDLLYARLVPDQAKETDAGARRAYEERVLR
ncbi:MAG TPA: SDR family oxidoreductase [Solirubrobacteraceae bacterium]|nr:SDR family oxidoreductase [Solirubrobacteraceae bacterium]